MLRMTVEGVGIDHERQTVVLLKDWEGRKLLIIWIDANQARAIALELEGAKAPRPLSHDLLFTCIQAAGGRVARIVINDLQDRTFYATVDIDTPQGIKHIDARPSDAIALAVRAKCPVFADGGALEALIEINEVTENAPPDDVKRHHPLSPVDKSESTLPALPPASDPDNDEALARFKRLIGELDL